MVLTSGARLRIAMVAGETSGDMLASSVLRGLAQRTAALEAFGIGGPAMADAGFEAWWPSEQLAVRGYVEVLRRYPALRAIRARLRERLIDLRPEVFVGVDAPDFNLDLERALRSAGLRTAHFIGPSLWAWRGKRIARIRESVDHMLLVFPFEPQIYREAGIPATYVGHPLADEIPLDIDREAARSALAADVRRPLVAVLPGSRASEIQYIAPCFIETVRWLAAQRRELQFVMPAATDALFARLKAMVAAAALPAHVDLRVIRGASHRAMAAADTILLASGTATLEAALHKRPMVIAYRMNRITYRLMRRMAYLPYIGLPNILCGEFVVPEFVQDAATPPAMGAALLAQLDDAAGAARLAERFGGLHEQLRQDCAARAAQALLELRDAG